MTGVPTLGESATESLRGGAFRSIRFCSIAPPSWVEAHRSPAGRRSVRYNWPPTSGRLVTKSRRASFRIARPPPASTSVSRGSRCLPRPARSTSSPGSSPESHPRGNASSVAIAEAEHSRLHAQRSGAAQFPRAGVGEGTPATTRGLHPEPRGLDPGDARAAITDGVRGAAHAANHRRSNISEQSHGERLGWPARVRLLHARRSHQPPAPGRGSDCISRSRRRRSCAISCGSRRSAGPREPVGFRSPEPSTGPRSPEIWSPPRTTRYCTSTRPRPPALPPPPGRRRLIASIPTRLHKQCPELAAATDVDGNSLLDNTVVVYVSENRPRVGPQSNSTCPSWCSAARTRGRGQHVPEITDGPLPGQTGLTSSGGTGNRPVNDAWLALASNLRRQPGFAWQSHPIHRPFAGAGRLSSLPSRDPAPRRAPAGDVPRRINFVL